MSTEVVQDGDYIEKPDTTENIEVTRSPASGRTGRRNLSTNHKS